MYGFLLGFNKVIHFRNPDRRNSLGWFQALALGSWYRIKHGSGRHVSTN